MLSSSFDVSTVIVSLLAVLIGFVIFSIVFRDPTRPPVVTSYIPFLRSAIAFGSAPSEFLSKARAKYGNIFTVQLGAKNMTFITDPTVYSTIMKDRVNLSFTPIGDDVAINSLAISPKTQHNEELNTTVHQHYITYLSGAGLDSLTADMQTYLIKYFNYLRPQYVNEQQIGLLTFVQNAIFTAATKAMFGDVFDEQMEKNTSSGEINNSFTEAFYSTDGTLISAFRTFDSYFPLFLANLPSFMLKKGIKARDTLVSIFGTRICRPNASSWMQARTDVFNKASVPEKDIGALQNGMVWAAQANTIPAAFWTIYYLLKHPDAFKRVIDEITSVAGNGNEDGNQFLFTRESLKSLVLVDSAISEALRLTTGSIVMRRVVQDYQLNVGNKNYTLKKGDSVALYPYLTHHDENIYPQPQQFIVDRFLDKRADGDTMTDLNGNRIPHAFMPFGGGITLCPGRHFARNEIKITLTMLLHNFEFALSDSASPSPALDNSRAGLGIFPPTKDVLVTVKAKRAN